MQPSYNPQEIVEAYLQIDHNQPFYKQFQIIKNKFGLDWKSDSSLRHVLRNNGIEIKSTAKGFEGKKKFDYDAVCAEYAKVDKNQTFKKQGEIIAEKLGYDWKSTSALRHILYMRGIPIEATQKGIKKPHKQKYDYDAVCRAYKEVNKDQTLVAQVKIINEKLNINISYKTLKRILKKHNIEAVSSHPVSENQYRAGTGRIYDYELIAETYENKINKNQFFKHQLEQLNRLLGLNLPLGSFRDILKKQNVEIIIIKKDKTIKKRKAKKPKRVPIIYNNDKQETIQYVLIDPKKERKKNKRLPVKFNTQKQAKFKFKIIKPPRIRKKKYDYDLIAETYDKVNKRQPFSWQVDELKGILGITCGQSTIRLALKEKNKEIIIIKPEPKPKPVTKPKPQAKPDVKSEPAKKKKEKLYYISESDRQIIEEFNKITDHKVPLYKRAILVGHNLGLDWTEANAASKLRTVFTRCGLKTNMIFKPKQPTQPKKEEEIKHIVPERLKTTSYQFEVDKASKDRLNEIAKELGIDPKLLGGSMIIAAVRAAESGELLLEHELNDGSILNIDNTELNREKELLKIIDNET